MPTSQYFNNFNSTAEQNLLEDLIIESIRIYGIDVYYVPRVLNEYDKLFGEDAQSSYLTPYFIEMYIRSIDGFSGDRQFMSKFGLEIRDQIVFNVSKKVFNQEVGNFRPNEGDIIYFPLTQQCFQIKFVEKYEIFYQLGKVYTWNMTCELFEYADEVFNTGIPEIDAIQTTYSTNVLDWAITDENSNVLSDGNFIVDGNLNSTDNYIILERFDLESIIINADNDVIQDGSNNFPIGSNDFIDFSEENPFSLGNI